MSEMTVQVRETQVRARPSFMAPVSKTLRYGDRVDVLEKKSGWARIEVEGKTAWVHLSALTKEDIDLKAADGSVSTYATGDEVALAGKGFTEEVEARYKEQSNLDYTDIDEMEHFGATPEEVCAFLIEGQLAMAKECAP